ncbi:MAG: hypothetical protein RQ863_05910 [Sulfolobales archaeon]|nr:hypothetical protein [Sulfolobales archaeon]
MSDIYTTVKSIAKNLEDQYLVFEGEFEAFTPWWGGNEFGYTFYPQPHYPEAKEIIGKTKWAIRTLCGHVPKELGFSEGEKASASQVKVIVERLNEGVRYFNSVPPVGSSRDDYSTRLNAMREAGRMLLFKGYTPSRKYDNLVNKLLQNKEFYELYKLLAIPRFYLRAMGSNDMSPSQIMQELLKSQPMKPGLRIRVKVYSKNKEISKLFVNAMLLTLKLLGIGSAANRGFGRFRLVKVNYAIEGIDGKAELSNPKEIDDFISERINKNVKCEKVNDERFPRFPPGHEIRLIKPVCAPIDIKKKYNVNSVEGVLSAIGLATLKSTWKAHCGNLRGSGREYHTWVLGLPRKVKGKGYVGYVIDPVKQSRAEINRRQSYIVISPTVDNGVLLLPFVANDYHLIYHRDHGEVEVTKIKRFTPNCKSEQPSSSVADHVNTALDWLEELLSC